MKSIIHDCRVHAHADNNGVHLVITNSRGATCMFTPPASPVVQEWAEEMKELAETAVRFGQTELPL